MTQKANLGFLGGGQLARMSIQAAQRMGLSCLTLDPSEDSCSSQIAPALVGSLSDPEAIAALMTRSERVTLENEFILAQALETACNLAGFDPGNIVPSIATLGTIQDKFAQRLALARAGVPSPKAFRIDEDLPFPVVLKARYGGYDGKGTRYARTQDEFEALRPTWDQPFLPNPNEPGWYAEEFVSFRRELAVMVYRSPSVTGAYPTMETVQTNHVCDLVFPADLDASEIAIAAVGAVQGFGLFGVELFEDQNGNLSVNEIAPRPHNTGHYTLDWGGISQFEMHVRLVMGFPVPAHVEGSAVCMANLLAPDIAEFDLRKAEALALTEPGIQVHWYGKGLRPGRKVGHINATHGQIKTAAIAARERFWRTRS
ncbi:MAG: ATP-grasp domain-containing protein [Fimbriimonadaceae bacterium]